MKQAISGPVGAIIVVVIVGILLFFGYNMFLKGPGTITPEQMKADMAKGMKQQQEQGQRRSNEGTGGGYSKP